jgi:hypothetical protein
MAVTALLIAASVVAGLVIGLRVRPLIALIVAAMSALVVLLLFGYALSNYPNCEEGQPCPPGERVIEHLNGALEVGALTLLLTVAARFVVSKRHVQGSTDSTSS